jgi:DHA2 family multidrug resistance protein
MGFAGRLVYRFPTRNLVAVGAVSFAAGMWLLSKITLDVGTADLVPPLILRGTGIGLMFVPLALASSAGLHGRDLAEASGMFNLTRQLGGSAGIAFLSTVLDRSMARHRAFLVESVTPYSSAAMERIDLLNKGLHLKGIPHPLIHKEAMAVVDMSVTGQAAVMGFADVFRSLAVVMIVSLPLLLLLKRARQSRGESISVH